MPDQPAFVPATPPPGLPPAYDTGPPSDQNALARLGAAVRTRLEADPAAYRIPVEGAELYAVARFLSPAECTRFMGLVDQVARPSSTYTPAEAVHRTSYSGDVERGDPFVQMIERRIDDLLGIEPGFGESVQGQRYAVGQEFKAHHDWFYPRAAYWPNEVKRGGQRSWTAMIYLNDVEEGGTTEFLRLGIGIPPQAGTLLAWNNARPDGIVNDATLHAATPVLRGQKYVITKWYRTRRWQ
ncbi:MAG: 2OG-Fe(II) oxygenase [Proteobacteria bacterium]|nr:2OG-Fe(II) oxygenase [Pseudomonadota bacterium]